MEASLSSLAAATASFVGGHFLLSSRAVRKPMAARLGEGPWRGLYAALVLGAFVWMLWAYGRRRGWSCGRRPPGPGICRSWSCRSRPSLAVAGLSTRNVTLVGGEAAAQGAGPGAGIMRVTPAPVPLWAVALWHCHTCRPTATPPA